MLLPLTDSVTYEVEESQENYDDIDASPEDTETTAEVHDGPRPAPEGDAGVPKEQAQNNEDYLVPGQDGWAWTSRKLKSIKILCMEKKSWFELNLFVTKI